MKLEPKDIENRLLVEGSLPEIVRTYESAFPKPLKNTFYSWTGFAVAVIISGFAWFLDVGYPQLTATISNLVSLAIALAGVALGFGLAGVAIYTSSLKPETLELLTRANYPETNISALRFILSTFVYVIVAFLKLVVACIIFYLFVSDSSFILDIVSHAFEKKLLSKVFFNLLYFPYFSYSFVFAFSNLWSFVLNLHRSILIIAATDLTLHVRKK